MNSTTTSTTAPPRRTGAIIRRLGAGSALAAALLAAGASPALAGTVHPGGAAHSVTQNRTRGTRIAVPVRLGPAISITRTAGSITVVR